MASALGSAIASLSTTGLEAYEIDQGAPVSIAQTTIAGVPVTSVTVGSVLQGTSGTVIVIVLLIVAALIAYFYFKR